VIHFFKNNILLSLGIVIAVVSIFLSVLAFRSTQKLEIVFLDVGQGDATLVTTPNGRQILIDAGVKNNLGQTLSQYMSASDRSLDLIVMTHPDLDHVGGMVSLVDRYDIDLIMHSGLLAGAPVYAAIAERVNQKNIKTMTAEAGQVIQLDTDVHLEIYSPYSEYESLESNEFSIIARLVYKDTSVMLTGDAVKVNEYEVVETYRDRLKSDILKVGHHGSQTSTSDVFVETVNPEYGVISAGCSNRFGHPHGNVLTTLFTNQVEVFDTCNDGDVIFKSNGEFWQVKNER
jgi:competence protein ComEC